MKQLYATLIAIITIAQFSYGQNTFPTPSGNVGIGTTTGLNVPLTVQGGGTTTGLTNIATTLTTRFNTANIPITLGVGYVSSDNPFLQAFNSINSTVNSLIINPFGGNVGIGTITPIGKLTIDDGSTGSSASEIFTLKTTYGISGRKAVTWRDGSNITGQIDTYYDGTRTNMSFGHLYNSAYQTGDIMTLLGNGNVGIGTTIPVSALNVVRGGTNASTDYPSIRITTTSSGNIYGPVLYLDGSSGTNGRIWGLIGSGPADASATGSSGNFAIYDGSVGASRLVINNAGYVGIGTTTPREALSVNGNIRSQQVKVEISNWPDFVFTKEYKLPSLLEVKNYIDQNHHLPDVPSEQEVKDNGLNLGEINKTLTKKVEELTLYAIEQQNKIADQDKLLIEQHKDIEELKTQVAKLIKQ